MSTLAELQTEVAEEIGSIDATADATKINRFLNRGVRDILRKTRCYVTSQTITPGATADYALAATVLDISVLYATASGNEYRLERVSPAEIVDMRLNGTASSPARYYALAGFNTVMWYPTPAAADTFTMYYTPAPTAMSSGSHDPATSTYGNIPEDYHHLIARYAMRFLGSFDDDTSSAQGSRYWEEYKEGLREMRAELNRKGGNRLPRSRVGSPRRMHRDESKDF
jgi:hypothetical protein